MKILLPAVVLSCVMLTACQTKYGLGNAEPSTLPSTTTGAATSPGTAVPISTLQGTIASARGDLKFVVVDFSPSPVPAVGTRMSVYREGQKVGELQISGPAEASNIAADLIAGKAQAGDLVRAD